MRTTATAERATRRTRPTSPAWPRGGGELGRLIRDKDWSDSPLGASDRWPAVLRNAVDLILPSPLGMVVLWGPDLIQLYNEAYQRLMGEKHPNGLGQPTAQCWPETWAFNKPIYDRVRRGEHCQFDDLRLHLRRSGKLEESWFDLTYSPIANDDEIAGILVTVVEVTERHRVGHALFESEQRFRALVEASSQAVWEADGRGILRIDSPSWRSYTGQSRRQWLDNRWLDAVHPDDRARAERNWADAVSTGRHMDVEFRLRHAGDPQVYRWTKVFAAPLRREDGTIVKWVGMNTDVDARRRADQALRHSERRLEGLIAGIPQIVWRAVNAGEWTWASPQWTLLTGQSEQDSHGWGWLDPVHPDDRALARRRWAEAPARGGFAVKYRLCTVNRSYRWYQTRARPVFDDEGEITEWLGTSTDIDDLQRLRQHERVLVAELQHRVRGTFATIRSIARRTAENTRDVEGFLAHFEGRLAAFARTQNHVTRDPNAGISLLGILSDELLAHQAVGDRVEISGPEVILTARTADTLGLAIHELVANSVKYGALGKEDGHLRVGWQDSGGGDRIDFTWQEHVPGGISSPGSGGFGTELLEETLPYELHADVGLSFEPDGMKCHIGLPLRRTETMQQGDLLMEPLASIT